jgi:hypothetical protein
MRIIAVHFGRMSEVDGPNGPSGIIEACDEP